MLDILNQIAKYNGYNNWQELKDTVMKETVVFYMPPYINLTFSSAVFNTFKEHGITLSTDEKSNTLIMEKINEPTDNEQ